ncbi:hypothetical protein EYF80_010608 [Liparis tanakae]|uniref:Uncharacterized protein n=1 Tax=Liparis tanakae TaxID=230148 RepID=A0A4Z2IM88_9TELE|nr:hypothetical protein EYF80_010608 [Liparis tanakae]
MAALRAKTQSAFAHPAAGASRTAAEARRQAVTEAQYGQIYHLQLMVEPKTLSDDVIEQPSSCPGAIRRTSCRSFPATHLAERMSFEQFQPRTSMMFLFAASSNYDKIYSTTMEQSNCTHMDTVEEAVR